MLALVASSAGCSTPSAREVDNRVTQSEPSPPSQQQLHDWGVCSGTCDVTGVLSVEHPSLGPVLMLTVLDDAIPTALAVDASGGIAWMKRDDDSAPYFQFEFANPATDNSGNYFVLYNPGRHNGVLILRPSEKGFTPLSTLYGDFVEGADLLPFYGANLTKLHDGLYSIELERNDCMPSCADGTHTKTLWHWDGDTYKLE